MTPSRWGSLEDTAFAVCSALDANRVTAVLVGGGAAAFYAPEAYATRDLDFVLPFAIGRPSAAPLFDLGFRQTPSRGIYAHPECPLTLEFLNGPLAVGDEVLTSWSTLHRGEEMLHILSPTDCVRDRLSAAIAWNDANSVHQAASVARRQEVDLPQVKAWCVMEGGSKWFDLLLTLLDRR